MTIILWNSKTRRIVAEFFKGSILTIIKEEYDGPNGEMTYARMLCNF